MARLFPRKVGYSVCRGKDIHKAGPCVWHELYNGRSCAWREGELEKCTKPDLERPRTNVLRAKVEKTSKCGRSAWVDRKACRFALLVCIPLAA